MKHEIKRGAKFLAKVNWDLELELRQPSPKQGEIIEVEAMWLMDEEDMKEEQRNKKVEELQAEIDKLKAMEFKPKLVDSWEELRDVRGFYIGDGSDVRELWGGSPATQTNKNIHATKKQALKSLAYAQLTQLMKQANGDWVADWKNELQVKYCIYSYEGMLDETTSVREYYDIALKDEETREHFLNKHADLLNQFFMH